MSRRAGVLDYESALRMQRAYLAAFERAAEVGGQPPVVAAMILAPEFWRGIFPDIEPPRVERLQFLLFAGLPPIISRKHAAAYFGGLVSTKTLANHDAAGKNSGPRVKFEAAGDVFYPLPHFLEWLERQNLRCRTLTMDGRAVAV